MITHKSELDKSVNLEFDGMECRYVRRNNEKMTVYLSSQKGCKQACRFCFLTQKGYTDDTNVTIEEYERQIDAVFDCYLDDPEPAIRVNFDLMAKGEPFENFDLLNNFADFYELCESFASDYELDFKINISSILPQWVNENDIDRFYSWDKVRIYYSLYSLNPDFRKKWLPRANPFPIDNLKQLYMLQKKYNKPYRVHWCYISGENDTSDQTHALGEILANHGSPNVNIVRYNPFSGQQGKESAFDNIQSNAWILKKTYGLNVKIIPRVGFDVNASCGMFI